LTRPRPFGLFQGSWRRAGGARARRDTPGFAAIRPSLEVAIDVADAQGLLLRRLTLDDLEAFHGIGVWLNGQSLIPYP
jgi:hypothetical protein